MPQGDSFQLYDLRVEVVCPPGKRVLCGAKAGDYFTLQGEMMHLPPNQGISIYSLGKSMISNPGVYIYENVTNISSFEQPQYFLS